LTQVKHGVVAGVIGSGLLAAGVWNGKKMSGEGAVIAYLVSTLECGK
jgi:hypothetical protein